MTTTNDAPVLLTVTTPIAAAHRAEFLEVVTTLIETARKEEGVLSYSVGEDLLEPGTYVFVERYRNDQALAEHQALPQCQSLLSGLPSWLARGTTVRVGTVGQETTMPLEPAAG
ncbi:MAG: putative quinol monooxygenase [Catenulispora sp.]